MLPTNSGLQAITNAEQAQDYRLKTTGYDYNITPSGLQAMTTTLHALVYRLRLQHYALWSTGYDYGIPLSGLHATNCNFLKWKTFNFVAAVSNSVIF